MSEHHDAHHERPVMPPTSIKTPPHLLNQMAIPNFRRDICVDYFIPLRKCRTREGPSPRVCGPERHEYERCLFAVAEQDMTKYNERHTAEMVKRSRIARGVEDSE